MNDIELRAELAQLRKLLTDAQQIITKLQKENSELHKENENLSKQLRKYDNENSPSGMKPYYLKTTLERIIEETKPPEEEKEHKENQRNARPANIDRKEKHVLMECPDCGGELNEKKRKLHRHIIHIKLPEIEDVDHECCAYYCPACKKEVVATVPDALPNSKFDLTTVILISFFSVALNMSMGNIRENFSRVFGLDISEATIANQLQKLKNYLGKDYEKLEKELKSSKVRFKDETGWRYNGKTFWVWVIATTNGVLYRIEKSRSKRVAQKMQSHSGVDECDCYSVYDKLGGRKQRCWSHSMRIAKTPEYGFRDDREIEEYKKLVGKIGRLFHNSKEDKKKKGVSVKLRLIYEKKLLKVLQSPKWLGRNTDKLVNYIMKRDEEWFTFLEFEDVEPTNNRAERALRHVVVKRKISQQSRSLKSMASYAMQASLFATSREKGENYVDSLRNVLNREIAEMGKS